MSEQRKCKMQDSPPGSSCSGPGALAQQGCQRESGRGGVLGGRSAPSEVHAGLPVSTPTLGQGVLAPPAEPSTGPRSCSKTEAGCRALGVLPELLISWISGRLLGAVDTPPPPGHAQWSAAPGGLSSTTCRASWSLCECPATGTGFGGGPEASPASRETTPTDQGHKAEPQGRPEAAWGNRLWPRPRPGSSPTLGGPGPHGTPGAETCRHAGRGLEVVPSQVRTTWSPLSKPTWSLRRAPWQRAGDRQLPGDLRGGGRRGF